MAEEEDPDDAPGQWYADVAAAIREKPPDAIAHELPGLVDHLTEDAPEVDRFVVGVSFTKKHGCLDYAIDRVVEADGDTLVETVKPPASERHRYVQFAHPPDPYFDAAALRARLLGAVHRERREAADGPTSDLADLWEEL